MHNYGFFKVATACPKTCVANPLYNSKEIEKIMVSASKEDVSLIVFPELSLSSYSCGDLFFSDTLKESVIFELNRLSILTKKLNIAVFVGLPLNIKNKLFNCCALLADGEIKGIIPKNNTPNYGEFNELRWFSSGDVLPLDEIEFECGMVPIGRDLLFKINDAIICAEICEDLLAPNSSSAYLCSLGANIVCNLSASTFLVGKKNKIKTLIKSNSYISHNAYLYSSAGIMESTADSLFSGQCIIAENGSILEDSSNLDFKSSYITTDIDLQRLENDRNKSNTFASSKGGKFISISNLNSVLNLHRKISKTPFIPKTSKDEYFEEVLNIQSLSLAKRLNHTNINHPILGVSGGLDSTLALLVAVLTVDKLNLKRSDVLGVTMPGFGTTDKTHNNAVKLMQALGVSIKEIDITKACEIHFKDIGHNEKNYDVVFENAQARERTQILFDLSNKVGGLVVGSGDLSELALGFCTYGGDHMSMYCVNSGVPKTLIKSIIEYLAIKFGGEIKDILFDILATPISPELLPKGKNDNIAQKTESIIGDYMLHDFFLYYFVRFGFSAQKIKHMANIAFKDIYSQDTISKTLKIFMERFFSQQFKLSCMPDGPKIGSVCLSPRYDFKMPSDASSYIWTLNLNE